MDQEQFQRTARELLERHIAETNQPNWVTPEAAEICAVSASRRWLYPSQ